ncbi:MAG: DUF445 family protein [Eubacteriales bacterium]|nr:DUF445 family protein [Eubacteriales bacterium]
MNIIRILLPIAVGALIGYCTNYIAIKMLFHPRKPVTFMGKTLPFTPGVIPKNQSRIAQAVGSAVGESLLTSEDIVEALKSDEIKDAIARETASQIMNPEVTLVSCVEKFSPSGASETMEKLGDILTEKVVEGASRIDYTDLISKTAVPAILQKVQNSMLAMFVNENMLQSFVEPIGDSVRWYMEDNGTEIFRPIVQNEIDKMQDLSVNEMLAAVKVDEAFVEKTVGDLYDQLVEEKAQEALKHFHIADLVEKKVNSMNVEELEALTMSVMKQELQAVINLGALIGAVIGIINIFI